MPKIKVHSGLKKRVKITGSGKTLFKKSCKNHLLSSKSKRQKKSSALGLLAPAGHKKTIARLLNLSK